MKSGEEYLAIQRPYDPTRLPEIPFRTSRKTRNFGVDTCCFA